MSNPPSSWTSGNRGQQYFDDLIEEVSRTLAPVEEPDASDADEYLMGLGSAAHPLGTMGEFRLAFAILEDALQLITLAKRKPYHTDVQARRAFRRRKVRERREILDAFVWVLERGMNRVHSFERICELVDIEPNGLRERTFRFINRTEAAIRTLLRDEIPRVCEALPGRGRVRPRRYRLADARRRARRG